MKESKWNMFIGSSIFKGLILFIMGIFLIFGRENIISSNQIGMSLVILSVLFLIIEFWTSYRIRKSKKSAEITNQDHSKIAYYLEKNNIKYIYAPKDEKMLDFYLPEYRVYVKYWGKDFSEREKLLKYVKKREIKLVEVFYDKINDIKLLHSSFMKKLSEQLKKR